MTEFCIETYFNNLEENADTINVSCVSSNPLNYLPHVTRFKNLRILNCANNQLTKLPRLNTNIEHLYCYNNRLTELPTLNKNLQILFCSNNQLVTLPTLNKNLQQLFCSNNQLTKLPTLNENLLLLTYDYNPIYEIINSDDLFIINTKLQILHQFCHLYYCLKFKTQFRDLLWKNIREPKIIQNYHPSYLKQLLTDENTDIDMVLDNWL